MDISNSLKVDPSSIHLTLILPKGTCIADWDKVIQNLDNIEETLQEKIPGLSIYKIMSKSPSKDDCEEFLSFVYNYDAHFNQIGHKKYASFLKKISNQEDIKFYENNLVI